MRELPGVEFPFSTRIGASVRNLFRAMGLLGIFRGIVSTLGHPFFCALFSLALLPELRKKVHTMVAIFWMTLRLFSRFG
jgi:hypothetical protein